jgi:hypothetical protein
MMNVQINNFPQSAIHMKWIVCRAVDGTVWYYDAWHYDRQSAAEAQAREVDGFVVENTAWLKDVFKS